MEDCGRKVLFNHPQSRAQARGSHTQHYSDTLPCCTPSPQSARLLRTPSPAHRIFVILRTPFYSSSSIALHAHPDRAGQRAVHSCTAIRSAKCRKQNTEFRNYFLVRHLNPVSCDVCVSPPPTRGPLSSRPARPGGAPGLPLCQPATTGGR
mgnify:CR=1 FL=1